MVTPSVSGLRYLQPLADVVGALVFILVPSLIAADMTDLCTSPLL